MLFRSNGVDATGAANEWSWFWQVVTVVLVVAAIAVDIATFGMATPATGAGLLAWTGFLAVQIGAPLLLGYLAGKALEQSILTQEEPSEGLDTLRAVTMWAQLIEGIIMIGVPIVKLAARTGAKIVRYFKSAPKVSVPWEPAAQVPRGLSSVRSSVSFTIVEESAPLLGNGARDSLRQGIGRASQGGESMASFSVKGNNRQ